MRRLNGVRLDLGDLVCEIAELLPHYLSDRVYQKRCERLQRLLNPMSSRCTHFYRLKLCSGDV